MERRRIHIITHTGCDMPLAEAEALHVSVIPDRVIFGSETYRNMTEITAETFYRRLEEAKELPTSSQPSMGDYLRAYREAAQGADEILCLMITSQMSGCYQGAVAAAKAAERQGFSIPIYVYDTRQCSHGMAQMVRAAVKMAESGLNSKEIMEQLSALQSRIGVYFVLESLKNARKGGRVGAVKALAADVLGIKPVLFFADGLVRDFAVAKSFAEGLKRIEDLFLEECDPADPVTVFHAAAPEQAQHLKERLEKLLPQIQIRVEPVGPVIGIYTGSGCVGLAFTKKDLPE